MSETPRRRVPILMFLLVGMTVGFAVVAVLASVSVSISLSEGHVGLVPPWLIIAFTAVFGLLLGAIVGLLGAGAYALVRGSNGLSRWARAFVVGIPTIAVGVAVFAFLTPAGPQNFYGVFVAASPGLALLVASLLYDRGREGTPRDM